VALAQVARQRAQEVAPRRELRPEPSSPRRDRDEYELGHEQRRRGGGEQGKRIGADDRRPAVSLQIPPLPGSLRELVLVVDTRAWLDPELAAGEAKPQREVDVLVVEEEVLGEAAHLHEALARDGEAGARDESRLG
jgi:hypothetical protein